MQEAITILEHSEVVLMKKIKAMKDGKPKYAASEKLNEIRYAISVLKTHEDMDELLAADEDAYLTQQFIDNPPVANA
jgi:hypothetical protein